MQNFSFLSLDKKLIALQIDHCIYHQSISQMMRLSSGPIGLQWETSICFIMFSKKEEVESIGNPAGIGQGTGFGLGEQDRDEIGLGHYRLRTTFKGPRSRLRICRKDQKRTKIAPMRGVKKNENRKLQ